MKHPFQTVPAGSSYSTLLHYVLVKRHENKYEVKGIGASNSTRCICNLTYGFRSETERPQCQQRPREKQREAESSTSVPIREK